MAEGGSHGAPPTQLKHARHTYLNTWILVLFWQADLECLGETWPLSHDLDQPELQQSLAVHICTSTVTWVRSTRYCYGATNIMYIQNYAYVYMY